MLRMKSHHIRKTQQRLLLKADIWKKKKKKKGRGEDSGKVFHLFDRGRRREKVDASPAVFGKGARREKKRRRQRKKMCFGFPRLEDV